MGIESRQAGESKVSWDKLSAHAETGVLERSGELFLASVETKAGASAEIVDGAGLESLLRTGKLLREWNQTQRRLVRKDAESDLVRYGWSQNGWLRALEGLPPLRWGEALSKDAFADAAGGSFVPVEVQANPNCKEAWRFPDGRLACEPFILSEYILSELHDGFYKLDEFAEALCARSDVAFATRQGRWEKEPARLLRAPLRGDEPGIGGIISDIEHHLEEGESMPEEKERLVLVFYPSAAQAEELVFWDSETQGRTPEARKSGVFFVERRIVREILGGAEFMKRPLLEDDEAPKRKFKC